MEKDKSAVESFLGELGVQEDKNVFSAEQEDPFIKENAEPAGEVVEEVKEEKPLPFNKDPKVQRFIEKEISKRLAEYQPTESVRESKEENDEVIDALTAVIGNDTPEKRRAIQAMTDKLNEGTQKIAEWENQQQQAIVAEEEAVEELDNAFDNIEENFGVDISSNNPIAKKTRQDFLNFVERIAPKDRDGDIVEYPDMNSAWETFSEIRKSNTQPSRAKELASRSMARSSEAVVKQDISKLGFDNILEHLGQK